MAWSVILARGTFVTRPSPARRRWSGGPRLRSKHGSWIRHHDQEERQAPSHRAHGLLDRLGARARDRQRRRAHRRQHRRQLRPLTRARGVVTIVSRAGGVTATSRSSNLTGPYARCDPGGPHSKQPAGNNTVRRIILTLL